MDEQSAAGRDAPAPTVAVTADVADSHGVDDRGTHELDRFVDLVRTHREQVQRLREEGDLAATVAELDVAHEELRTAEEEMRTQHEQIEDLLALNAGERAWRERVAAALPVPVVVSDRHGTITEANAAAGFLMGLEPSHLVGKPVQVYVDGADRPLLRRALSELSSSGVDLRTTVTLIPRRRRPVVVSVVGFDEPAPAGVGCQVRWVLLPGPVPGQDDGAHARDLATAAAFAELCRLPVQEAGDMQAVLGRVATIARQAVPAAEAISVSLGDPVSPDMLGTESRLAQAVDGAQIRAGEGPCADAWANRRTVRTEDVGTDDRWRALHPLVADLDVGGVLSVPVHVEDGVLGVLNLYATRGRTFDRESTDIAELLGAAVGAVVEDGRHRESLVRLSEQLRSALDSRAVIDQAKGILMALHGLTADEAFARLAAVSRNSNVKLREVAARLVEGRRPATGDPAGHA